MKITASLLAAAMLAGCASTSFPDASSLDGGHAPGAEAPSDLGPDIDRCMWMKPRCRAR